MPRGQPAVLDHLVAQVALLLGETLLWAKIAYNVFHYYFKIRYCFLNKLCRLQVEDTQCFPVEEGPGETILVLPCGDGVTN